MLAYLRFLNANLLVRTPALVAGVCLTATLMAGTARAEDQADPAQQKKRQVSPLKETIVVTGSYEPLALEESDRPVSVLDVRGQELLSNTLVDFLRLEPSVDLRQRGPDGAQADVSIRGGTFSQTLILLNGWRLNDVQTGHHNMDVPVPLQSVERVEILRGSGSTLYGSDAVGGVVHFVASPPKVTEIRLRSSIGNFGVNQQRGTLGFVTHRLSQQFGFSRDFSSGFRPNRDYRNISLASMTHWSSSLGRTEVLLAHHDRPFGADRFYGNFNSWERTRTWFGGVRQDFGRHHEVSLAYRRHTDLFVLFRDQPEVFTNRHAVEGYQAAWRYRQEGARNMRFFGGAEGYHDQILSNNLGNHNRGRLAGYAAVDFRALNRFSLTVGAREEFHGSLDAELSPSVGGGVWLNEQFKLRASFSRAFRLPSFTDLYYHDPANLGSPDLRPESAWSYEAGLSWNGGGRVRADVGYFERRDRDVIDFVRASPDDLWRATNIQRLTFRGIEASVDAEWPRRNRLGIRYTALHGSRQPLPGLQSRYVFNYPVHSFVVSTLSPLPYGWTSRARLGILKRAARETYGVWDLYLARGAGRVRPFLQFTNLTNTMYEEIPSVPMPGRAVVVGLEFSVISRTK
ncbi:MAG: TonB-dependent receptor [Acidobacteria bacterium]|nr:TonB-dependent receptor [Acidobacteriota bacterium]